MTGGTSEEHLAGQARRLGPLPWSALGRRQGWPWPDGYGAWLAEALGQWWVELGHPDPYVVVEAACAHGREHRAGAELWAALPAREWAGALHYVAVGAEPGAAGPVWEDPSLVLGAYEPTGADDGEQRPQPRRGPVAAMLADLPAGVDTGVVVASGYLATLPADRFEHVDGQWLEVRLAAPEHAGAAPGQAPHGAEGAGGLWELRVPADPDRLLPADAEDGDTYWAQDAATAWLGRALAVLERGVVVVVDHVDPDGRTPVASDGPSPLALDQLASVRPPVSNVAIEDFPLLRCLRWDVR